MNIAEANLTIHLVPSTHWDREWYLPFRRYQTRLVRLFDKVQKLIAEKDYPNFLMDGQWIVIEDYLEIKPDQKDILKEAIISNKLTFGPWYVIPDTFIVSGESLIRNLQIGYGFAKEYGAQLQIGYSPDCFGMAAQLPQIYSQFGFTAAMFTRGQRVENKSTVEMWWESPDGTRLPAIFGEYSLGLPLVIPTVWKNIDRLSSDVGFAINEAKRLIKADNLRSTLHNRLWIVGVDHLEPKENLPQLVKELNENVEHVNFVLSDMKSYFKDFVAEMQNKSVPISNGEQRGKYQDHFVLGNTLSTRIDLKMLNRAAENKLTYVSCPLAALSERDKSFSSFDSKSILDFAWKLLIQNHSHDSICCCSIDEVMIDVEQRIKHSCQLVREVEKEEINRLGSKICPKSSKGAILVYNPLPFERSQRIEADVAIPYKLDGLYLADEDGRPLKGASVINIFQKRIDIETLKANEFNELLADTTRYLLGGEEQEDIYTGIRVSFQADQIPACGYRCYYFTDVKSEDVLPALSKSRILENDYLKVTVNLDGTLNIFQKKSRKMISQTNYYEIQQDDGDTYTFSPGEMLIITKGQHATIEYHENNINIEHHITFGSGYLDISANYQLNKSDKYLSIETKIVNHCENLRVRAILEYPDLTDCARGNTAFDLTQRPIFDKGQLTEKNIMTMPLRDVLLIPFISGDEAIYSDSVHEYEAFTDNGKTKVALTLMRAIGKGYSTLTLTKDETNCGKGVRWWTKKAQMQGAINLRYGLRGYEKTVDEIEVMNDALAFSLPLTLYGILAEGTQSPRKERCRIKGAVLSLIDSIDEKTLVRIYNPSNKISTASIWIDKEFFNAYKCDLRGIFIANLTSNDNHTLVFDLRPHEICTIMLEDIRNQIVVEY